MKIKKIQLKDFKRFSDLTIDLNSCEAKLIVLVGGNGCGKSSLLDSLYLWQRYHAYYNTVDNTYAVKKSAIDSGSSNSYTNNIIVNLDKAPSRQEDYKSVFYFRTAYRNEPELSWNGMRNVDDPFSVNVDKRMCKNDASISKNYQMMVANTIQGVYNGEKDMLTVGELRDELVGKINTSLKNVFGGNLVLSSLGNPASNGGFYFTKGDSVDFDYKNLSSGEKAVFDIVLDLVLKSVYYPDSIYCIDEPEAHMHTGLQSKLLEEIFNLINENSQLIIATHSLGMLKKAKELDIKNPGSVIFLNFDGYDFDKKVEMLPSKPNYELLTKMFELALDDYSDYLITETIIFCEGNNGGNERKNFDARCYSNIFSTLDKGVIFYSADACTDILTNNRLLDFSKLLLPKNHIIAVIDRDDRSEEEIEDAKKKGVKVLTRRNLESYLLDDSIITELCHDNGKDNLVSDALKIKHDAILDSVKRGNPADDLKKAAGTIYVELKRLLTLTGCGNNTDTFLRDTMSKLIKPGMAVYKELYKDIFGDE